MPINPNVISSLILAVTGIIVFYKYYKLLSFYNRFLWGIFSLSIALNALTELLALVVPDALDTFPELTLACERTLGAVAVVSASWCVVMRYEAGKFLLFCTIGLGLLLFYCIVMYKVQFMGLIIQPFCIIVSLLISCIGLATKQKSSLWIIFSMMLLALASKSRDIPIPMDPIDISRYLMLLSVLCFGYAIRDQYKILF
ncbi:hypothetical protein [Dyadobacter psychrotolerans]|uniref:Uncharacterized protein n=1 Tax=Dyadobacter psychrotolerans TaxID=2541721 RepID=A0A4R5DQW7_9BACT|nr:hypothetical protein [Dyadobacter psychrotolerans]TDE16689.1 hypothetical protein E0F88_10695 [Dyadobacter psychrotolerans]